MSDTKKWITVNGRHVPVKSDGSISLPSKSKKTLSKSDELSVKGNDEKKPKKSSSSADSSSKKKYTTKYKEWTGKKRTYTTKYKAKKS